MRDFDHFGLGFIVDRVYDRLDNPQPVVATGLPRIDFLLDGGIRPGEVFILAARPRVGKSAFALQVILSLTSYDKCVALWTLEMSEEQWTRRALAALTSVDPSSIRIGGEALDRSAREKLALVKADFKRLPLSFARGGHTIEEIRFEAELQVKYNQPALLVVDYLQLIEPSGKQSYSREQEVARVSRELKKMAKDLSVPVMALCQLRRSAEGKVPVLGDLRESGALEQDADEVLLLHRHEEDESHLLKADGFAILAKNRDGREGIVKVSYDWKHYRFAETLERVA